MPGTDQQHQASMVELSKSSEVSGKAQNSELQLLLLPRLHDGPHLKFKFRMFFSQKS